MKCKYCDFLQILDNHEVVVEICKECGRKIIYNKRDGRIDNAKYLKDHIRQFAQPFGRTRKVFEELYGKVGVKIAMEYLRKKQSKKTTIGKNLDSK